MTVFATVRTLTVESLNRAWRAWQRVNPLAPAPRVRRRYPRMTCPSCGQDVAYSAVTRLSARHYCPAIAGVHQTHIDLPSSRPDPGQADGGRRSTASPGALGASETGPSADTEIRGGTCDL